MKDFKRLFKFLKPQAPLFVLASFFMVLSALFDGISLTMLLPLADKVLTNKRIILPTRLPSNLTMLVDKINSIPPLVLLNYLVVTIVVLFIVKGIVLFFQGYFMSDVSQRVVTDLRCRLYAKMQDLSLDYFSHQRGGELMSRVTNDVLQVGTAISSGLVDFIYQSLQVVVFAGLIFFIYIKLAVLAIIILPCISIPIVIISKALKKIFRRSQEKMADINSILYETILGARVVKAFNAEKYEQSKFRMANRDAYKLYMKSTKRVLIVGPLTEMIGVTAGVYVFWSQGKEVIAGTISFGVLMVSLAALLSMVRPFRRLSQVSGIIQQAIAASNRIYEVLDTQPSVKERHEAVELHAFREGIVFEDVSFSYGQNDVLKNIDLKVRAGEVVAIVGPSGAGKTTLLDLIPRFYDPTNGRITIDGKDIKEFSLKSLRNHVALVTQETILFNDSVRANIAYGLPKVKQDEITRAAKLAHIHDVITQLPQGYNTFIGDRGTKLSGGERQRLAIARALLKNAPILVLDEATSQLDTESERLVQGALNRLMTGRTVFIIAHRLSTVRNTGRICVLSAGQIVEMGNHEELLKKPNGLYKKLYLNQSAQIDSDAATC